MSELKTYKFDKLYEIGSGISSTPEQAGHGTPFVSFSEIFNNFFLSEELPDLMAVSEREEQTYSVKKGDIFLTRTSETLDELAMSSVAVKDYPRATFSGFAKRLRPLQDNITYDKFMGFYLRSPHFRKVIDSNAVMTLRASFNKEIFSYLKLYLPDYPTQVKIGDLLYKMGEKKGLNEKINRDLEILAKTIYDYWFVQFDFPNRNGRPYKTSGGKMVWNEQLKREIPEGWEVEELFKVMDVQYGFPFDTSKFTNDITQKPVIRIRDILENSISAYSKEDVHDKYILHRKDLLIGMDGNFHMNFWDKDGAYLNQRSVRIRSRNDSEVSNFQAIFELSPYIKAREKNVSRTTVGHLGDKDLKRLFLISPNKSDRFRPKKTFDSLLEKIILNRLESQKLSELRNWLLPMLMNGQVKVV